MRNLIGRLLAQHRVFLLASTLVLAAFHYLLCAIVASIDLEQALSQVLMFAPPVMRTMVEQTMLGGSSAGVLAFGWNHPITHALATAVAVTLATRAVAGEVENGTIELVLAQPISRETYLAAHVVFAVAAMTLFAIGGGLGTLIGERVYGVRAFGNTALGELIVNLVLLQSALYALTLVFSAFGREAGPVALAGVQLAVISYFLNVIASLWSKAHFLLPYSLHSYYDPRAILVRSELDGVHLIILIGWTLACIAIAYSRLRTRDLP